MKKIKFWQSMAISFLAFVVVVIIVRAGNLEPSTDPAATSYTLADIYTRLTTNETSTEADHDLGPADSPAGSFFTLKQIYEAIPTIVANTIKLGSSYLGIDGTLTPDGGTAGAGDVFNGKTANLTGDWDLDTGILNLACNVSIFDGTENKIGNDYDGDGNGADRWCMTNSGDAEAGNIASGKICWVDGTAVTGTFDPYSPQKWQTKDDWLSGALTSGEYIAEESVWTTATTTFSGADAIDYADNGADSARVLDLYSNTVKIDGRTGLWWSDIAVLDGGTTATTTTNGFTLSADGARPTGGNAIGFCEALNSYNGGAGFGGYTDWYLPTQKELMQAYIDGSANNITNPGYYFWSSTEYNSNSAIAWYTNLTYGYTTTNNRTTNRYGVRCVRR